MEVYSLEAIIALAFRINTFGAEQVRRAILERLYLRKEMCIRDSYNPNFIHYGSNAVNASTQN